MYKNDDLTALKANNLIRAAVWIVVLAGFACYACAEAANKFQRQGEADSISRYNGSVWAMCAIAVVVAALWWWCATFSAGKGRRIVEEYSFAASLLCIVLVCLAAVAVFFFEHSIIDRDGRSHTMWLIAVFPAVFGWLMYCIPPVNLRKVIWPFGPRVIGGAVFTAICLGVMYLLFWK